MEKENKPNYYTIIITLQICIIIILIIFMGCNSEIDDSKLYSLRQKMNMNRTQEIIFGIFGTLGWLILFAVTIKFGLKGINE